MYARSKPEDEDEPKEIKYQAGQHFDDSLIMETEKVRRRKFVPFVPFGLYCFSCNTLMRDEDYKALEEEERKMKLVGFSGPYVMVQGYDNGGYFHRVLHYATCDDGEDDVTQAMDRRHIELVHPASLF
jgi:hypothetical protein